MFKKTALVTVAVAAVFGSVGCRHDAASGEQPGAQAAALIKQVTVADVARFVETKTATVVDANGADTRQEYGVVPGALLLSSHNNYAMSELPASKATKLVFYCGGVMCRASDAAAERAAANGYTDVNIMRDGIKGWKSAGEPTEAPRS